MAEVSSRALSYFVDAAAAGAVDLTKLTAGLDVPLSVFTDPNGHISWDVWTQLCERMLTAMGSEAAFIASARFSVNPSYAGELVHLAGLMTSAREVYRLALMWGAPVIFRTATFAVGPASGRDAHFDVTVTIADAVRPSRAWLLVVEGFLAVLPRFVQGTDARVERLELGEAHARWRVCPPKISRSPDAPRPDAEALLDELVSQQKQLSRAWADLSRAHDSTKALARSEASVRALLKVFPDVVLRLSADGILLDVQGGHALAGVGHLAASIGEPIGPSALAAMELPPAISDGLMTALPNAMAEDRPQKLSLTGTGSDGQPRSLLVQLLPVGNELFVILHDDTERREVERRLVVAERMSSIGTLAAGVAHEINNPLTYILTNVWLVRETFEKMPDGEERTEMLSVANEIEEGARRIRDAVSRMRELSRVEPARREIISPRVSLERALSAAHNQLRHRAVVTTDLRDTGSVLGDPTAVTQVFVNLLLNAAEAIPEGQPAAAHAVRVTLTEQDAMAIIEVEDTGSGIPAAYLGRIFDPFFTTKTSAAGTGLGLAVVHRTVTGMRGTIDVASEPGKGSRFRVSLPVARHERAKAVAVEKVASSRPTPRMRIVVIDDDALVSRALLRLLRGHDVATYTEGEDGAAAILAEPPPDLVLCDLMMPGLSGIGIWEKVKTERPALLDRIVFVTGGAFTESADRFLRETKARILRKPVPAAQLRALVAERAQANAAKAKP